MAREKAVAAERREGICCCQVMEALQARMVDREVAGEDLKAEVIKRVKEAVMVALEECAELGYSMTSLNSNSNSSSS